MPVAETFKRPFSAHVSHKISKLIIFWHSLSVLLLRLIKKREKTLKHYFSLFQANKIIFVLCPLTWQYLEYHGLELQTEHGM